MSPFTPAETSRYVMANPSWKHVLVGRFPLGYSSWHDIVAAFTSFRLVGQYELYGLCHRHIIIRLSDSCDYVTMLIRGLWMVRGAPLHVFKWTPGFKTTEDPSVVPVWVTFPKLPLHMYHRDMLFVVTSRLGTPLTVDAPMARRDRCSHARVCIELDVSQPLVDRFLIDLGDARVEQRVIYERLPRYCTSCRTLGHAVVDCRRSGPSRVAMEARRGPRPAVVPPIEERIVTPIEERIVPPIEERDATAAEMTGRRRRRRMRRRRQGRVDGMG
ncbi:uncharacterized protein LOC127253665 [Andrographis paniculata]|uniref:uncharacterized protein LOC127253665 n=1 Tax=Andrographis paniculata TaxID=175694 RepID=UPI0021E85A55|nr:uncharacterized protein LOC127253665 [Andrographis paniculata]